MTKRDELQRRYEIAAHAVQAGVAMELNDQLPTVSQSAASPKMLLIAKGVFTEEEYFEELVKGVEAEQAAYEERLSARYGGKTKIKLV